MSTTIVKIICDYSLCEEGWFGSNGEFYGKLKPYKIEIKKYGVTKEWRN